MTPAAEMSIQDLVDRVNRQRCMDQILFLGLKKKKQKLKKQIKELEMVHIFYANLNDDVNSDYCNEMSNYR